MQNASWPPFQATLASGSRGTFFKEDSSLLLCWAPSRICWKPGKAAQVWGLGILQNSCFPPLRLQPRRPRRPRRRAGPKSEAVKGRARHCLSTCPSCPLFRAAGGLWILTVWLHCPSALVRGPRSNTTFWYPQEECWGRRWTHSPDHLHHPRS